jgi:Na+/H+-dicarboxylate symporter
MMTRPAHVLFWFAIFIAVVYGLNWLLQKYLLWLFLMGLFVWSGG